MKTFNYSLIHENRRRQDVSCDSQDHKATNMIRAGMVHDGTVVLQCKKCLKLTAMSVMEWQHLNA